MMKTKISIKEFEELEDIEHGQVVDFEHNFCPNYYEESEDSCDGEVYWESVMEGLVCSKCNLYTGVK